MVFLILKKELYRIRYKDQFKKDVFGNLKNDPRLKGVSAKSENNITTVKRSFYKL